MRQLSLHLALSILIAGSTFSADAPTAAELMMLGTLRNNVSPNANEFEVESFLHANHMDYTDDGADAPTLKAGVPHTPQNYLIKGSLTITFTFDAQKHLKHYDVKETPPDDMNGAENPITTIPTPLAAAPPVSPSPLPVTPPDSALQPLPLPPTEPPAAATPNGQDN